MSSLLRIVVRRPRALLAAAQKHLAFLEREHGFEREPTSLPTYRRGDERVELSRTANVFGEAVFLEWTGPRLPGSPGRYFFTGVIKERADYDRELARMAIELATMMRDLGRYEGAAG